MTPSAPKPSAPPLQSSVTTKPDHLEIVFQGALSTASRATFERTLVRIEKAFPTSVVIDLVLVSRREHQKGVNSLVDFLLALRQKGNLVRYRGLCEKLGGPLVKLGLARREEVAGGASRAPAPAPSPAPAPASPRTEKTSATQVTKTRTARTKAKARSGKTKLIPKAEATKLSQVSLQISGNTSVLEFETSGASPDEPPSSPSSPPPLPATAGSYLLRQTLENKTSDEGRQLWKKLEESPQLTALLRAPGEEDAELTYLAKDRTHALLIDRSAHAGTLAPKHLNLFAAQLARMVVDSEFPLAKATIVFLVPAGSSTKLPAVFNEGFKMPAAKMSRTALSQCRLSDRGVRQAKNAVRYPVALTYKDRKVEIPITVRIVELPASLF